jgi:cytochrome c553
MLARCFASMLVFALSAFAVRAQGDPKSVDFFETKIRPVLAEKCYSCHGTEKQRGDIRLDGREHFTKERDEGAVINLKEAKQSRLVRAIRHEGDAKMPPKGDKLPAHVIADFEAWIAAGATWPASKSTTADANLAKSHWAFQPVKKPSLPAVRDQKWIETPVDAFILAKLEAKNITPNPVADRRTLLRRLKADLLGLPPTFEETEAFAADKSPDAYAKLVERYLSSPAYGERWGRYWLDIARYADNKGYVFQEERRYPYAYTYRDYVVKSLNDDVPFDRFVREQIAADRLVAKKQSPDSSQAAMGFLTLGRRFLNSQPDIIDDRIDVVTRGLLGLTVQCARCHDHKFDPIPAKDYYSLYGIFASSTEPKDLPLVGVPDDTEDYRAFKKKLDDLEGAVTKFREDHKKELEEKRRDIRDQLQALQRKVDAHKVNSSGAPPRAMVIIDAPTMNNPRVFLRGNPSNLGPAVPRQFLEVASPGGRKPFTDGSGRLELADAIVSRDNPLTARVFVNRVWLNHFGKGLVDTPSDFGIRTGPPTHPELLDYLAAKFMDEGWSVKSLHKWIVLSKTYQLSSAANSAAAAVDPDNRHLARANRRRLDFEGLRDSILAATGALDATVGGRPVDIVTDKNVRRRTIYGFIDRQNLPSMFRTFDFASPDTTSPQRYQTTVPQQALFLLNSPFLLEQSKSLLKRADVAEAKDTPAKVQALYRAVYARPADDVEVQVAESFLRDAINDADRPNQLSAWERYGQALLVANEFAIVD